MAGAVTRFAPSPTGRLHLGHAFAALTAADLADGNRFVLRIEDIDRPRCRPEFETAIFDDLRWLGLSWSEPVMRQSERLPAYAAALARLQALGVTYACTCTRGDIRAALGAPQEGAAHGPDGPVYPGTCRHARHPMQGAAIRLNMARALALAGPPDFVEEGPLFPGLHQIAAAELVQTTGDIVLARRDIGTSYHLAVVVDDAAQGITLVTRGADLFSATPLQRLLQRLLALPEPRYHHHRLIRDDTGKRLAKRDDARALALWRSEGGSACELRALLGFAPSSCEKYAGG
jgi:glutamyl-Q tRNA(Asp) synthetase